MEFMTENFDLSGVFEEQIRPLMSQVHDICVKNGLSFVAGFAVSNEIKRDDNAQRDYDVGIAGSVFLNGPNRTPPELVVADKAFREGLDSALSVAFALKQAGGETTRVVEVTEEPDTNTVH